MRQVSRLSSAVATPAITLSDLAELLTVIDEFLRSSEEVTDLLTRFPAGGGEQPPGAPGQDTSPRAAASPRSPPGSAP